MIGYSSTSILVFGQVWSKWFYISSYLSKSNFNFFSRKIILYPIFEFQVTIHTKNYIMDVKQRPTTVYMDFLLAKKNNWLMMKLLPWTEKVCHELLNFYAFFLYFGYNILNYLYLLLRLPLFLQGRYLIKIEIFNHFLLKTKHLS